MKVKFSVDGIKNMDILYTWTKSLLFESLEGDQENYHGTDYCKKVVEDVNNQFSNMVTVYKGQVGRIANEQFVVVLNGQEFILSFGINTYDKTIARIECMIESQDADCYNHELERLKIELKNRLIRDWRICTWLMDEQSECLCRDAFQKAYHVENDLRAFASKILIHYLGINWIESFGFEKTAESVRNLKPKFVQRVPEFDNINTEFLSMTLETLVKIMTKGVIYDSNDVIINRHDFNLIQDKSANKKGADAIVDYLRGKLTIEKYIWDDLFLPFIDNESDFKKNLHDFIENRNHVAHSKVLAWNSYQMIEKQFLEFDRMIITAINKFETEEVSQEIIATWDAEENALQEQAEREAYEKDYYRDRLESETGMDILDEDEILDWFDSVLHDLYDKVYQCYNLDASFELSDYCNGINGDCVFSVNCPAVEDGSAKISLFVEYDIEDNLGENSICSLFCKDSNELPVYFKQ